MSEQDFFGGSSGAPAISWDGVAKGTTVTGVIVEPHQTVQMTDIDTGEPMTWRDGNPRMQAVLTLQTEFRNFEHVSERFLENAKEAGDADDGLRRLYVYGSMKAPSLNKAVRDAMRKAKHRGAPEVGATLSATFLRKAPIPDSSFKRNEFEATYASPTPESLKVVATHRDAQPAKAEDPWSSGPDDSPASAKSDEPPF